MRETALVVSLLWFVSAGALAQPSVEAGRRGYEVCAGCHGFAAEGNALVNAPRLAGLQVWYLERQMRAFVSGARGSSAGDPHGQRMATMARAAATERDLQDLLAYIATLPGAAPPDAVGGPEGRVAAGAERYALCAACHGASGEGNEALGAPSLAVLDDWYLVEQLRLYADGLRGYDVGDAYGQQMRALAGTFADEQMRLDLAAYIRSLEP